MTTETLCTYHTRTGLVAFVVRRHTSAHGLVSYSYDGKHGAGSGRDLEHIKNMCRLTLRSHPAVRLHSGTSIEQL